VRVLVVSYFAPLADHQAGGVQQWVHHLLPRLVRRDLDITVVCPDRPDGPLLDAGPRLRIRPELREEGRRELRADEVRRNHEALARHAAGADVVWVIDRHLPIRVPQPVVLTWTTVAYLDELQGLMGDNWDVAVAPSPYMVRIAQALLGPDAGPVLCVPVPVDVDRFRRVDPAPVVEAAQGRPYLLFPHRPDAQKGADVALQVMAELARAGAPHRLLIPLPPASVRAMRRYERRLVQRLQARAGAVGVSERVVFYPWAPPAAMPGLYSAAEWTLALSRLPEGFMLTPAESIACGTPVIATPAGALPEVLPEGHGLVVQDGFRDASAIAARVLAGPPPREEVERGARHVASRYGADAVADAYVRILSSTRKREPAYRRPTSSGLVLSPWCRPLGAPGALWHDLQMRVIRLNAVEAAYVAGLRDAEAGEERAVPGPVRSRLLELGVLVPSAGRT
jgi:glycosyltransferase involved in cell wall biosynthesis